MNQNNYNPSNISDFLGILRTYNASIGNYEQHSVLDDTYTYSIKLTNGSIRIYFEELQQKAVIPEERLKQIAIRFNQRK
jgi:hypothetical protein